MNVKREINHPIPLIFNIKQTKKYFNNLKRLLIWSEDGYVLSLPTILIIKQAKKCRKPYGYSKSRIFSQ